MKTAVDIIVCICMAVALYYNWTSIPKQDYTCCNNPWKHPVTSGPLEKIQYER